jgi:glycosyltransferase involved in cell wall biosynthesis
LHLIGLVESVDHVCCRYRLRAFRDQFVAAGHTLELEPLSHNWGARWRTFAGLRRADAVILLRRLLPPWEVGFIRRCARRLIFDFDDAVFLRDSYSDAERSRRRKRRFEAIARATDAVVAGNTWLAAQARAAGATRTVRVVPSCVDPNRYPRAMHDSADGVRLIWVGSSSTLQGLERVRDLLDAVGAAVPNVRLKLVSDRFAEFGRLPVEQCTWSEQSETAEIAAADIGISWLPDDDWSRGKCGVKVLQYMAAGLPVVANPVGVQTDLVRHGETGFLATTPAEWVEAVRRLAADPDLRRRMGVLARWRVEREFSVEHGGRLWRDLLDTMAAHRRVAG